MAYSNSKNPFFTDEDDDFSFGGSGNRGVSYGSGGRKKDPFEELDDDDLGEPYNSVQDQTQKSMNRQLDGTKRALSSIYDSERMGVATAEELVHQGEQLDNVERKTAQINQDMKVTQKHINSIKSVFGGIKNWWQGGDKKKPSVAEEPTTYTPTSSLASTMENSRNAQSARPHPGLKDVSGFYEDDTDFGSSGKKAGGYSQPSSQKQQTGKQSAYQEYEDDLNKDLDLMTDGMSRLKGLAMGLGDEIGRQNEQVDRINTQVDRADLTIQRQNKEMFGILGGKKK